MFIYTLIYTDICFINTFSSKKILTKAVINFPMIFSLTSICRDLNLTDIC